MRRIFHIVLLTVILLGGCRKEEPLSYVGRWEYLDSEPDLGPDYADSYLVIAKDFDYHFFDAPSGKTIKGTWEDFSNEGLTITLTPGAGYDFPVISFKLTRLKDNLMVVETWDVGEGDPTTIRFSRVGGY
jgi:hypothetical protein